MADLSQPKPLRTDNKSDIFKTNLRSVGDAQAFEALTSSLSDMLGSGSATTARAVAR